MSPRKKSGEGHSTYEADVEEAGESRPSRTEQTRAATEVNRLGLALTRLSPRDLDTLELSERLREEIDLSQGLKPKSRGRQNRLIGQLLRAEDHESIEQRLAALEKGRRNEVQHEHLNERWVVRLVEEGDSAVEALLQDYASADRQRIRLLVRNARKTRSVLHRSELAGNCYAQSGRSGHDLVKTGVAISPVRFFGA